MSSKLHTSRIVGATGYNDFEVTDPDGSITYERWYNCKCGEPHMNMFTQSGTDLMNDKLREHTIMICLRCGNGVAGKTQEECHANWNKLQTAKGFDYDEMCRIIEEVYKEQDK